MEIYFEEKSSFLLHKKYLYTYIFLAPTYFLNRYPVYFCTILTFHHCLFYTEYLPTGRIDIFYFSQESKSTFVRSHKKNLIFLLLVFFYLHFNYFNENIFVFLISISSTFPQKLINIQFHSSFIEKKNLKS